MHLTHFIQVAIEGLEGAEENYLNSNSILTLPQLISQMAELKEGKNISKMEGFLLLNAQANYFDEMIVKAEEYILERIGVFKNRGLKFKGVPLENLKLTII